MALAHTYACSHMAILHVIGLVPAKGVSAIEAAAKVVRRVEVLLGAGMADVGVLATGTAIFTQGAHAAAKGLEDAMRSHQPEATSEARQFGHMRKQSAALFETALVQGVEGLMVRHVDDEVGAATFQLHAIIPPAADETMAGLGSVACHRGQHHRRQDVIRMVDEDGQLSGGHGEIHFLWRTDEENVI